MKWVSTKYAFPSCHGNPANLFFEHQEHNLNYVHTPLALKESKVVGGVRREEIKGGTRKGVRG